MTTMPKKLILKSQEAKRERSKNKRLCRDVSELLIDEYKGLAQWMAWEVLGFLQSFSLVLTWSHSLECFSLVPPSLLLSLLSSLLTSITTIMLRVN